MCLGLVLERKQSFLFQFFVCLFICCCFWGGGGGGGGGSGVAVVVFSLPDMIIETSYANSVGQIKLF